MADAHFLDITTQVCPLTFVRARLALERLAPGTVLVIRLNDGEPLENLPRSLAALGYRVVSVVAEADGARVHRLTVARD
jgi:TusA-related sulfurtransferase